MKSCSDGFYGTEDINLHNVDVMTDVLMAPTTFTRYTMTASTALRTSNFVSFFTSPYRVPYVNHADEARNESWKERWDPVEKGRLTKKNTF